MKGDRFQLEAPQRQKLIYTLPDLVRACIYARTHACTNHSLAWLHQPLARLATGMGLKPRPKPPSVFQNPPQGLRRRPVRRSTDPIPTFQANDVVGIYDRPGEYVVQGLDTVLSVAGRPPVYSLRRRFLSGQASSTDLVRRATRSVGPLCGL